MVSRLPVKMESALLPLRRFPPPPAGAHVFAGAHGPRAGGAPDRAEASVVEGVEGKWGAPVVSPPPGCAPTRVRVGLKTPDRLAPSEPPARPPRDRLPPPQARHPELQAVKCPSQRRDLADLATLLSVGDARAE